LRGWSSLQTRFAIFPGGLLVALLAPRVATLVGRFGVAAIGLRFRRAQPQVVADVVVEEAEAA